MGFVFGPWCVVSFLVLKSSESWLLYCLLSSCRHVIVIFLCLFLTVQCVVLQYVTGALPGHTHFYVHRGLFSLIVV